MGKAKLAQAALVRNWKWMAALTGGGALGGTVGGALYAAPEFRGSITREAAKTGLVAGGVTALAIHGRKEVKAAAKASAKYIFRRIRGRIVPILIRAKLT